MSHEELKNQLEFALSQIVSELNTIAVQQPETGDWVAIPAIEDRANADANLDADVTEDWNVRRATLGQLETRYRNITRALKKFETGNYGICEISGEPIETERLAVNPAARTNLANINREKELPL
jgi:RNA polymerase-binding transcription factor DksA